MKIVFVQTSPSQLDAPFYRKLSAALNGRIAVVVWNDYGKRRNRIDPELGVVPEFPEMNGYQSSWVDKRVSRLFSLWRLIMKQTPKMVILQDQTWLERIFLSVLLRLSGVNVGVRSDKNLVSDNVRVGLKQQVEAVVVRIFFDFLVPVSDLTSSYYMWPSNRVSINFPYCSDDEKFSPGDAKALAVRSEVRQRNKIPLGSKVFLSVLKFSDRENPRAVIESFRILSRLDPSTWLIMVGSGPLLDQEKGWVRNNNITNVLFTGYIPYVDLQDFFFAADVYIHLPKTGPWEVSVPDALLAGMGIIATKTVGSAISLLRDNLSRYLVDAGDVIGTSERMRELCEIDDIKLSFLPARKIVNECFSVSSVVKRWESWLQTDEERHR